MTVSLGAMAQFQEAVWEAYREYGRHDLPWRQPNDKGEFDPYRIMVSEVMLQQTQVPRVIPKFYDFISVFPTFEKLGDASLSDVLQLWSGLGYNRRAKYLWQAARIVRHDWHGVLPRDAESLAELPGIGIHTAGAIVAYSFNQPVVFIETNIRTVVLFHFFQSQEGVPDKQIAEVVRQALPEPGLTREWYWAVMDYGSQLKRQVGNVSRGAAAYTKQSRFEGSRRQIRGAVLRTLGASPKSLADLSAEIPDERLTAILAQLVGEELIHERNGLFLIGHES